MNVTYPLTHQENSKSHFWSKSSLVDLRYGPEVCNPILHTFPSHVSPHRNESISVNQDGEITNQMAQSEQEKNEEEKLLGAKGVFCD